MFFNSRGGPSAKKAVLSLDRTWGNLVYEVYKIIEQHIAEEMSHG